MAVNGKAIKQRIKSVKNTKKITKAMEMVSAAKMRKAIGSVLGTRTYAELARALMERLGDQIDMAKTPLMEEREINSVLVILISSNRGLCGSFNANLFKKLNSFIKENGTTIKYDILGIGKKSAYFAKRFSYPLTQVYDTIADSPSSVDIIPIITEALSGFRDKKYDKVIVAFTEFKSSIVQTPRIRQLLPISKKDIDAMLEAPKGSEENRAIDSTTQYSFEPNPEVILETILPRLIEMQLFQALLESRASEHSARMVAMKNATESAGDMIGSLSLEFNKARRAAITKEIAEISGGAAALE